MGQGMGLFTAKTYGAFMRVSGPGCFVSVRASQNHDKIYGAARPRHTVGPTDWPSGETGSVGIQDFESRQCKPLRVSLQGTGT